MNIGERIKQLRIEKNMSQDKLAAAAGITKASISNYERNLRSPQYSALCSIANALDVPLKELTSYTLEGTDNVSSIVNKDEIDDKRPRRARRLLTAFDKLSDEAQMKALERIEELTLISKYQVSLSESLQRYIYNKYLSAYQPVDDAKEQETYEQDDLPFGSRSCEVNVRHIMLKRESKTGTSCWHFKYYQLEADMEDYLINEILYRNEDYENRQDKYSLVFDDENIYQRFCSCYQTNRDNSDVDGFSEGNDNKPEITFFLIDSETWEIKGVNDSAEN